MPTFLPMIPSTDIALPFAPGPVRSSPRGVAIAASPLGENLPGKLLLVLLPERLDLDVDAGWQVQLHQRVDRLRRRLEDVEQPAVRAHLELLAALLVDVRRAVDRPAVLDRRQGARARHAGSGALCRVDDLAGGLVEDPIVVRFQPDPDLLVEHHGRAVPTR